MKPLLLWLCLMLSFAGFTTLLPSRTSSAALPSPLPLRASTWNALGAGVDLEVNAIAIDKHNNIYVAGHFGQAGGQAVHYVAKWDGSMWMPLGSGMNDWVLSLAVDTSGTLYAGGRFTTANGVPTSRIARWDGANWSPLGEGMNNPVVALVVGRDNILYAGGGFRLNGDASGYGLAQWDGTNWSYVGGGTNDAVYALAADTARGYIYAAGSFRMAGTLSANRVARWDGTAWSELGSGMNETTYALAVDTSGTLYAGGSFTALGDGTPMSRLAQWNASGWSEVGGGMNDVVTALAVDGRGDLYAGGGFTEVGGVMTQRIAQWNGNSWSPLGEGMASGRVSALAVTYSEGAAYLYAGGSFVGIGSDPSIRYIARWDGAAGLPTANDPHPSPSDLPRTYMLSAAFPNPFNPRTSFTLEVQETQPVTVRLYDALGRDAGLLYEGMLVAGQSHAITIEASHLPSGTYIYQAVGRTFRGARVVTLLK